MTSVPNVGHRPTGQLDAPMTEPYPITAEELAAKLGVDGRSLRALIRDHDLVPGHAKNAHYRIYPDVETEIAAHQAVQGLPRRRRQTHG